MLHASFTASVVLLIAVQARHQKQATTEPKRRPRHPIAKAVRLATSGARTSVNGLMWGWSFMTLETASVKLVCGKPALSKSSGTPAAKPHAPAARNSRTKVQNVACIRSLMHPCTRTRNTKLNTTAKPTTPRRKSLASMTLCSAIHSWLLRLDTTGNLLMLSMSLPSPTGRQYLKTACVWMSGTMSSVRVTITVLFSAPSASGVMLLLTQALPGQRVDVPGPLGQL
mmetsp:Transcript_17758/g.47475  ORF Transcript_17758/g.47475 Transcript_17758/m.47475 type:complete len:226 (+) Transcript_17758:1491-2168(+)